MSDKTIENNTHDSQNVNNQPASPQRREFLSTLRGLTTAGIAGGLTGAATLVAAPDAEASNVFDGIPVTAVSGDDRQQQVYKLRKDVAQYYKDLPLVPNVSNGDDARYANRLASFTKGMPHNSLGEVDL